MSRDAAGGELERPRATPELQNQHFHDYGEQEKRLHHIEDLSAGMMLTVSDVLKTPLLALTRSFGADFKSMVATLRKPGRRRGVTFLSDTGKIATPINAASVATLKACCAAAEFVIDSLKRLNVEVVRQKRRGIGHLGLDSDFGIALHNQRVRLYESLSTFASRLRTIVGFFTTKAPELRLCFVDVAKLLLQGGELSSAMKNLLSQEHAVKSAITNEPGMVEEPSGDEAEEYEKFLDAIDNEDDLFDWIDTEALPETAKMMNEREKRGEHDESLPQAEADNKLLSEAKILQDELATSHAVAYQCLPSSNSVTGMRCAAVGHKAARVQPTKDFNDKALGKKSWGWSEVSLPRESRVGFRDHFTAFSRMENCMIAPFQRNHGASEEMDGNAERVDTITDCDGAQLGTYSESVGFERNPDRQLGIGRKTKIFLQNWRLKSNLGNNG
jgi:hypothetical protein